MLPRRIKQMSKKSSALEDWQTPRHFNPPADLLEEEGLHWKKLLRDAWAIACSLENPPGEGRGDLDGHELG